MEFSTYPSEAAPANVQVACFRGTTGITEYHLLLRPTDYGPIDVQLDGLNQAYDAALTALGLHRATAAWRRFFCSDLTNQSAALASHPLARRDAPDDLCAISWVGQPPAPPAKVALWAYHLHDPTTSPDKQRAGPTLIWRRNGLMHCWTTGLAAPAASCYEQTRATLTAYGDLLRRQGLDLAHHTLRTWLFIRDIDVHYEDVVAARRDCFRAHGLMPDTHFIASTGIAGGGPDPAVPLTLDAYALGGARPSQISYLRAPTHLCPTHVYGVTFERGTAVTFRDRRQVFISGTASIDAEGRLLYPGDVVRQLGRALDNVAALLDEADAGLQDLAVLIAYVRDPADQAVVYSLLNERCPATPIEVVIAAICRPGWLVEVEGLATVSQSCPDLPAF